MANANKRKLKNFLGLTIVQSDTPIKVAQKLLGILGLKLSYIGRLGSRTQRERVYTFKFPDDGREEIFISWLQRDDISIQTTSANTSDTHNLSTVSTIGKDNDLSHRVDIETKLEKPNIIQSGAIVQWLKVNGKWMVEATTGIVAKIKDAYGKTAIVNCQELKLYQDK